MPAYSLLSEAWSDPIMKQTKNGNFIVNNNEEYDEEQVNQNIASNYSRNNDNLNINTKNSGNLNIYNTQTDPDSDLLLKNNHKRRRNHKLKQTIIEDFSNTNYKLPVNNEQEDEHEESDNEEEYKRTINELKNHVKTLENQIKSLKNDTIYQVKTSSINNNQTSLFNNVNTNELIVFGSIGIFTIMLIDSFTKIGMKLNSLKQ